MTYVHEPRLEPVSVLSLHPTQITVGMHQVRAKRDHLKSISKSKLEKFLGSHLIPVVYGYKERYYLTDHHHLARALYEEGVQDVAVTVLSDLHKLDKDSFWYVMDHYDWVHPFKEGVRQNYSDLPKSVAGLIDDPFRSLAGELRWAGGFSKHTSTFSEFLWANFLRHNMDRKDVDSDFKRALGRAFKLAKSKEASYLPGWCGPNERYA